MTAQSKFEGQRGRRLKPIVTLTTSQFFDHQNQESPGHKPESIVSGCLLYQIYVYDKGLTNGHRGNCAGCISDTSAKFPLNEGGSKPSSSVSTATAHNMMETEIDVQIPAPIGKG